jgi:transcriptional regulator with XRE-family HTH domain
MSIGETLAEARHEAGLSIAEVSERTRIRQSLILDIESDDYGECGGDFYARGHIRAIADAVGADQQSLIREYDAAHPAGKQLTVADLYKSASPVATRQRRMARRAAALAVVVLAVIGFACYEVVSGLGHTPGVGATAKTGAAAVSKPRKTPPKTHTAAPRPSPTAAAPPVPVRVLTPVSATAFGTGGTADGDNPQNAPLAIDGDPSTAWNTDWYTTPTFGNLYAGTGLLIYMGRRVTITSVEVTLGDTRGADLELRAGNSPVLTDLPQVASASDAAGATHLTPTSPVRAQYILLWFTSLPPDPAGTYQASVYTVTVTGRP